IIQQTPPGESPEHALARGVGAANKTNPMGSRCSWSVVMQDRRIRYWQLVRVPVARNGRGVVDEDEIENLRPTCGVINLIGLIEQPHCRFELQKALAPALYKTPPVHHKQQVGTKIRNFLWQSWVVPVGVLGSDFQRPCGLAKPGLENGAAGKEAVVDEKHP